MSDRTAIHTDDGRVTLIDVGQVHDDCAEHIADAVGAMIDGADHKAASIFREIAATLDGDDPEADNVRLRKTLRQAINSVRGRKSQVGKYTVYTPQIDVDRVEQWQGALSRGGNDE
jgi:hypothetical protein